MPSFGEPYRLYSFQAPDGRRMQFVDQGKAREAAQALGVAPSEVASSRVFYVKASEGGKSRRIATGCRTLELARRWLAERRRENAGLRAVAADRVGVESALDAWLQSLEDAGRRAATLRRYRGVADLARKAFGSRPVASLEVDDLAGLVAHGGGTPRTVNLRRDVLRAWLSWCARRGYVTRNVARDVEPRREPRRTPVAFTEEQFGALLRAASTSYERSCKALRNAGSRKGGRKTKKTSTWRQVHAPPPELAVALILAGTSGLRFGSITGLLWRNLDMKGRLIRLDASQTKVHADLTIPIAGSFAAALARLPLRGPDERVFQAASFRRAFESARRRADLDAKLTVHAVRRGVASWLLRRGISPEVVRALGGWAAPNDTMMKFYRAVGGEELRGAVDVLDGIVRGALGEAEGASKVGELA